MAIATSEVSSLSEQEQEYQGLAEAVVQDTEAELESLMLLQRLAKANTLDDCMQRSFGFPFLNKASIFSYLWPVIRLLLDAQTRAPKRAQVGLMLEQGKCGRPDVATGGIRDVDVRAGKVIVGTLSRCAHGFVNSFLSDPSAHLASSIRWSL